MNETDSDSWLEAVKNSLQINLWCCIVLCSWIISHFLLLTAAQLGKVDKGTAESVGGDGWSLSFCLLA
jgi:hypothetical protein